MLYVRGSAQVLLMKNCHFFTLAQGIVALSGMVDSKGNSILFCSYENNMVRVYELPRYVLSKAYL